MSIIDRDYVKEEADTLIISRKCFVGDILLAPSDELNEVISLVANVRDGKAPYKKVVFDRCKFADATTHTTTLLMSSPRCTYSACLFEDVTFTSEVNAVFEDGVEFLACKFGNVVFAKDCFEHASNLGCVEFRVGCALHDVTFEGKMSSAAFIHCAMVGVSFEDESEKMRSGVILKEPMIAYKAGIDRRGATREIRIITLEIPAGAIVFSINNGKRRANKAKCVSIETMSGEPCSMASSSYDSGFLYWPGGSYEIEDFSLDFNVECAPGIHFFSTKEEAMSYFAR